MFEDVKHSFKRKFFEIRFIFLIDLIFEIRTTFSFIFEAIFISFFSSFFTFENDDVIYFKMIIERFTKLIFSKLVLILTFVL